MDARERDSRSARGGPAEHLPVDEMDIGGEPGGIVHAADLLEQELPAARGIGLPEEFRLLKVRHLEELEAGAAGGTAPA